MERAHPSFHGPELDSSPFGSRPTGLILSGGAALGSWQGGVLYALEKEFGFSFHSVAGTSAGSLNGVAYFQDKTETLKSLWRDMPDGSFMRFAPRLNPPSLYSSDAVREFIGAMIDEESVRKNPRCWFYALSVDLCRGLNQAQYSPEAGGPWDGPLLEHVLGSAAVPFLFPPVLVRGENGGKPKMLIDGHLVSYIDLGVMVERGVRDFLFLNVASKVSLGKPRRNVRGYISTMVDRLLQGQVDAGLSGIKSLAREREIRAFAVHPAAPLNMSVFGFKKQECRAAFDRGLAEAAAFEKNPAAFRIL
jgi:predicted acylesterase/phospholipase RssA